MPTLRGHLVGSQPSVSPNCYDQWHYSSELSEKVCCMLFDDVYTKQLLIEAIASAHVHKFNIQ